ncbi:Pr6Pr family membrane protein [Labrys sp. (in: a-proteobacteria)]|uniref:Pr6Pr family membrane protein n=1 Tax=Labrys sp. (in: a-proteobacteria) TaxID=1917972 RepID=UPI0039E48F15
MTGNPGLGRLFAAMIALIAGAAVLLQVLLGIEAVQARGGSALEGVILVFSYFTVLTNTLVAIVSGASALLGERDGLLTRPGTRAAVAIYIFVVGVIFAALLTGLRPMSGLTLAVDSVLHRVVPVLYVLYWLLFVPKGRLSWRDPLAWMLYPLLYVAYSLLYGALTGRYLYPFADVTVLGYGGALANGLVILAGFLALGLIVVAIDQAMAPKEPA